MNNEELDDIYAQIQSEKEDYATMHDIDFISTDLSPDPHFWE